MNTTINVRNGNGPYVHYWFFFLLFFTPFVSAGTLSGIVVSVHDGDTVTILDATKTQYKIRLAGIDAPEIGQAYGKVSRNNLMQHVAGKRIKVDWSNVDKYQRILGTLLLDGKDQNIEQLRAGLAWHFKKYQNEQLPAEREAYAQAEKDAQNKGIGLWRDAKPIAPWEWRKTLKSNQKEITK